MREIRLFSLSTDGNAHAMGVIFFLLMDYYLVLFGIPYGPTDALILNGNVLHGVTNLKEPTKQGRKRQKMTLTRFSMQLYTDHKRNGNKNGPYGSYDCNVWKKLDGVVN